MYINQISIKNFRGFKSFTTKLLPMTIVIGENDAGKTNLFSAMSLPLSGNSVDYNKKRLTVSDINTQCIIEFFQAVIDNSDIEVLRS